MERGLTIDEIEETARLVEYAGAQAIHVSAYGVGSHGHLGPANLIPGSMVHLAGRVKRAVKVPVIAVGRISPSLAEEILKNERLI